MVVLYYGMNFGRVWWRYYEIVDRMKSAARYAPTQTNADILRRLHADADEIGLPPEAKRFQIQRTQGPLSITIKTDYSEKVELPFAHKTFTFRPAITQRF